MGFKKKTKQVNWTKCHVFYIFSFFAYEWDVKQKVYSDLVLAIQVFFSLQICELVIQEASFIFFFSNFQPNLFEC